MKQRWSDSLLIICLMLAILFCPIPTKQELDTKRTTMHAFSQDYNFEVGFGGPAITWVTVLCNRTAEIRFLCQEGVWISTETILLASFRTTAARYNFNAEHSTNIVQVRSDGPFEVQIIYTYKLEAELTLFTSGP
ncbi:MAG: hypothetical protein ACFFF9_16425 [Candidatus Thorarchaeota archaeon]